MFFTGLVPEVPVDVDSFSVELEPIEYVMLTPHFRFYHLELHR